MFNWHFLGFWPCSQKNGVAIETSHGHFVSVFLGSGDGCVKGPGEPRDFEFDIENGNPEHHWILFFKGCDDTSFGLRFETWSKAMTFIKETNMVDWQEIYLNNGVWITETEYQSLSYWN